MITPGVVQQVLLSMQWEGRECERECKKRERGSRRGKRGQGRGTASSLQRGEQATCKQPSDFRHIFNVWQQTFLESTGQPKQGQNCPPKDEQGKKRQQSALKAEHRKLPRADFGPWQVAVRSHKGPRNVQPSRAKSEATSNPWDDPASRKSSQGWRSSKLLSGDKWPNHNFLKSEFFQLSRGSPWQHAALENQVRSQAE